MLIGVLGYKGGIGKTSISNFLGDKLDKSIILNLDYYQSFREDTQSVDTISLDLSHSFHLNELFEKYNNIILDAGGFEDTRIFSIVDQFDALIFPTKTDIGDIRMLGNTINDILSHRTRPISPIIIINDFYDKEELEEAINDIETLLLPILNAKFPIKIIPFSHSKTVKRINKEKKTISILEQEYKNKQKNRSNFSPYLTINSKIQSIIDALKDNK